MSGSLVLRSGVGTQILTVSRSRTTPKSVVARSLPVLTSVCQRGARNIAHVGFARVDALDLAASQIDAGNRETCLGELDGQGQAHVAQPHDPHAGAAGSDFFF